MISGLAAVTSDSPQSFRLLRRIRILNTDI
jgi:hypothetical protein